MGGWGWASQRKALSVVAAVGASVAMIWLIPGAQNDFIYDWLSASAFLEGSNPYRSIGILAAEQGLGSSQALLEIHPRTPAALVIQSPIALFPYEWTYVLGRVLTVGSAFAFALVVTRILEVPMWLGAVAVPMLLITWPFSTVLLYSQSGFLVAALLGATVLLGDRASAGYFLAVAVSLKLWPWLLIPALWLTGRRKSAWTAMTVFIALNAVGLMLADVSLAGIGAMLTDAASFSSSSLASIASLPTWAAASIGLVAVAVATRFGDEPVSWSIILSLIVAPIVWVHYLPALVIPLAVLGRGLIARSVVDASRVENLPRRLPIAAPDGKQRTA